MSPLVRPFAVAVAFWDAMGVMRREGVRVFRQSYRAMVEANR
jgi:hypothetical protein